MSWWPWGEEALTLARLHDKPIFLSIGYAACHWCHVMEHESFEDEATAKAYLQMHTERLKGFGIAQVNAKVFDVNEPLSAITRGPLQ